MTPAPTTLQDLKAIANTKTGLVVMTIKRSFAPWRVGDVAGFPPETALDHLTQGIAIVGVHNKNEFRPAPKAPNIPGVTSANVPSPNRVSNQSPVLTETETGDKVVVPGPLPTDWADKHPLQVIKMAVDRGFDKSTIVEGEKVSDKAADFLRDFEKKQAAPIDPPTDKPAQT